MGSVGTRVISDNTVITRKALNYAEILYDTHVSAEAVSSAVEVLKTPELISALESPCISLAEKCAVIDRLFDKKICGLIKTICKHGDYSVLGIIGSAYGEIYCRRKNIVFGYFEYAEAISESEAERLKTALKAKYMADAVKLEMCENKEIISGFRLRIGDKVYDKSVLGVLERMKNELVRR